MKQSFQNQLSQWRKANNVINVEEALLNHTHHIEGQEISFITPMATMSTKSPYAVKLYITYKVERIKLMGKLRNAIASYDYMEVFFLREDMANLDREFFNEIRKASETEYVLSIEDNGLYDLEKEGLTFNLYPLVADEESSYELVKASFGSENGDVELLSLVIPYEKGGKK